ncbi:hypothetical protein OOZ63_04280 [Paucibacter sp. PLA-PC-4]|uniref:hypothetical protein n=1 Tax=Paucibacter sp. PLA-PC-4 TaxID=2993655 RepID=UPI002248ACBB|nr:hypothetical protein [Paucibacter sp. PLA-PC-4]MCX2861052.1 hypothetical protein [Paucibacter sp. PLA-PC-4]
MGQHGLAPGLQLGAIAEATLLNLLMFGVAAVAAWRIAASPFPVARAACSGWFAEMTAGMRSKWGVPLNRWWTIVEALMLVFVLPATGLLLPLRLQPLGLSSLCFGACAAALSLGLLVRVADMADALIARMAAGHIAAAQLAAATAAAGVLLHFPLGQVHLLLAAGFLLSGALLLAVPQLPRFLLLDHAEEKNWYGPQHPDAFARRR